MKSLSSDFNLNVSFREVKLDHVDCVTEYWVQGEMMVQLFARTSISAVIILAACEIENRLLLELAKLAMVLSFESA